MRERIGLFWGEAHSAPMYCCDCVCPSSMTPDGALALVESLLPGVHLTPQAVPTPTHGYVNTSRRPDGSLYVSIQLYRVPCPGDRCVASPHSAFGVHPPLTPAQVAAISTALEGGRVPLTTANAGAVLRHLGFNDDDPPLRGR